jgi:hypothetical protein
MGTEKIFTIKRQRSHKLEAVKVTQRGVTRWKIIGLYISGKRTRKFFVTQQEALEFIATENAKARNLGERARNIPGHLHEDALRANDSKGRRARRFLKSLKNTSKTKRET